MKGPKHVMLKHCSVRDPGLELKVGLTLESGESEGPRCHEDPWEPEQPTEREERNEYMGKRFLIMLSACGAVALRATCLLELDLLMLSWPLQLQLCARTHGVHAWVTWVELRVRRECMNTSVKHASVHDQPSNVSSHAQHMHIH